MISTQRLFLALWPNEAVRGQLAGHARYWTWPAGCLPYAPADWHVTLHFIGNVQSERFAEIVARAQVPLEPFDLVLDQPQVWHRGLAVLRASAWPEALRVLHGQLGRALQGLGLPVDSRPYQPHVTLARNASAVLPPTACAPVVWPVRSYALVVSTGSREQRYQVIRQYSGP